MKKLLIIFFIIFISNISFSQDPIKEKANVKGIIKSKKGDVAQENIIMGDLELNLNNSGDKQILSISGNLKDSVKDGKSDSININGNIELAGKLFAPSIAYNQKELTSLEKCITYLPVSIFIIVLIIVVFCLAKSGYDIKSALSEYISPNSDGIKMIELGNTLRQSARTSIELSQAKIKEAQTLRANNSTDPKIIVLDDEAQKLSQDGMNLLNESIGIINSGNILLTNNAKTPGVLPAQPGSSSRLVMFLSGVTAIIVSVTTLSYYYYMTIRYPSEQPDLSKILYFMLSLGIGVIPYAVNKFTEWKKDEFPPK